MKPELIRAKLAFAETIKGVGGLESGAAYCRVGKSVLGENQSLNRGDSFPAIDVVADLEKLSRDREGWPHVTQWLCGEMNGVFVGLPDGCPDGGDVLKGFALLSKEYGDSSAVILDALADGRISPAEAEAAERELNNLITQAVCVRELLRRLRLGGGR